METTRCVNCGFLNFASAQTCKRCGAGGVSGGRSVRSPRASSNGSDGERKTNRGAMRMALRVALVTLSLLFAWHVSITFTSESASFEQLQTIERAAQIIEEKDFRTQAFVLKHLVRYRASDSWWNNWVGHETAYAATNFPFEVVTIYKEFYEVPIDDTERAAILLHESYHLLGRGEAGAFEQVWRNKTQLGWTEDRYGQTNVWRVVREATENYAPHLFTCGPDGRGDCTEG